MIEMLASESTSLPPGWEWRKIEDLLYTGMRNHDIRQGKALPKGLAQDTEGNISFYDGGEIRGSKFPEKAARGISEKTFASMCQFAPGDLLIKRFGQYAGRSSILQESASANSQIFGVRFDQEKVDVTYVYWWLKSKYIQDYFVNALKGSTKRYITQGDIAEIKIPLPYPDEDRSLVTQHLLLQRLEACMKDVEVSWDLFRRMDQDVNRLLETTLGEIFSDSSRNAWKNKGKIEDFVEDFKKGEKRVKKNQNDEEKSMRYIIGSDIAEGTGLLVGNHSWDESKVKSFPYRFALGTVLYQMRDINRRRVTCVNFDGLHGEDIYPLRILPKVKLLPRFLTWLLLTPDFTQYALENAKHEEKGEEKDRPKLNKRKLLDYRIVFPDEGDQQRILSDLEGVLAGYNEFQRILTEEETALEQLEMSILDQAFLKGKL